MSRGNVQLVLAATDAVNRADVDAFVECFDSNVEWEMVGERFPGMEEIYRGHEGVRRWLKQVLEPWERLHLDVEEISEPSDDRVVVGTLMTTRGGSSGVQTQLRVWQVFHVADGLCIKRTGPYWTRDAAFEAVGLREEPMSQESVELVKRLLVDDADLVPLIRDHATYARMRAEVEALFDADCTFGWIAHGERAIEAIGLDASRQAWINWLEPWESYRAQVERIVAVDDNVIVVFRVRGRMAGTQNDVEMMGASVYLVRDGKVARLDHYADRAEALEAVGLRK